MFTSNGVYLLCFVAAVLSGIGVVVTFIIFKFLKATAKIKKKEYQVGGAAAGFLLVFSALTGFFFKAAPFFVRPVATPVGWKIEGDILKENKSRHNSITVSQVPPNNTDSNIAGHFFMKDVLTTRISELPRIQISADGFYPIEFDISSDTANIDTIQRKITLKRNVISPLPPGEAP